jgi:hypothetical protein
LIARSPEAALTGAFRPTATFTAAILTAAKRLKCAKSGHSGRYNERVKLTRKRRSVEGHWNSIAVDAAFRRFLPSAAQKAAIYGCLASGWP